MGKEKTLANINKHKHKNRGAARMQDTLANATSFDSRGVLNQRFQRFAYNKKTIGKKNFRAGYNELPRKNDPFVTLPLPTSQHGDWVTTKEPHVKPPLSSSTSLLHSGKKTASRLLVSPKQNKYTTASVQAACGPKSVQWRPQEKVVYSKARHLKDPTQREFSFIARSGSSNSKSAEGFTNLGNTCYINSGIQALLGLKPFVSDILRFVEKDSLSRSADGSITSVGPLTSAMQSILLRSKKHDSKTAMDSTAVKVAVEQHFPRFSGNAQHDVHEFVGCLLDQLDTETGTYSSTERDSIWDATSISNANFACEVLHTRTCLNNACAGATSSVEELFRSFSLDLQNSIQMNAAVPSSLQTNLHPPTIQSLLTSFFAIETVQYKCETCGHEKSTIHHRIKTLPRVVVLHLKRFDGITGDKINQSVQIRTNITLDFCCNSDETRPPPLLSISTEESAHSTTVLDAASSSAMPTATDDMSRASSAHLRRRLDFVSTKQREVSPPLHSLSDSSHRMFGMSEDEQLKLALQRSVEDAGAGGASITTSSGRVIYTIRDDDDIEEKHGLLYGCDDVDDTTPWRGDPPPVPRPSSENSYRLVSLVHHAGVSAQNGHYICDVWNLATNTWRCFNDSLVNEVDEKVVLGPNRRKNAYLLFYVHQHYIH